MLLLLLFSYCFFLYVVQNWLLVLWEQKSNFKKVHEIKAYSNDEVQDCHWFLLISSDYWKSLKCLDNIGDWLLIHCIVSSYDVNFNTFSRHYVTLRNNYELRIKYITAKTTAKITKRVKMHQGVSIRNGKSLFLSSFRFYKSRKNFKT